MNPASRLAATLVWLALAWAALAGPAAAETMFAQARVNQGDAAMVTLELRDGRLSAKPSTLEALGLAPPPGPRDKAIELAALPGVRYRVEAETQTVSIEADAHALIGSASSARAPPAGALASSDWGAAVEYGYSAIANKSGVTASAALQFRMFSPVGEAVTGVAINGDKIMRLDTAFSRDDAAHARRLVVGDFVSHSPIWSRSVRAAGVSLFTDYQIRPDIPTTPLPVVTGAGVAPSAVDVYVDDVLRYSGQQKPGPFSVSDLPVVDGRGNVRMVVTDVAGRRTTQSFGFYASTQTLRAGLSAYALEAGFLREDFAGRNDRYTDAFVQTAVRRGITDWLTAEGQVQVSGAAQTAGGGVVAKLAEQALLSAAINTARTRDGTSASMVVSAERRARSSAFSRLCSWRPRPSPIWRRAEARLRSVEPCRSAARSRRVWARCRSISHHSEAEAWISA